MKKTILTFVLALMGLCAWAKWYSVPAGYNADKGRLDISAKAECNKGKGEKFAKFLNRFNSDAEFRRERCRPSEAEPSADLLMPYTALLVNAADALADNGFVPLHGFVGDDVDGSGPIEAGIWYVIERDRVVYSTWKLDPAIECDSNGAVILFERIGGKWFFADCWPFGRLSDSILGR